MYRTVNLHKAMCQSSVIRSTDFLGYLTKDMGGVSSLTPLQDVTVKLNGIPTSLRIYTGADVINQQGAKVAEW